MKPLFLACRTATFSVLVERGRDVWCLFLVIKGHQSYWVRASPFWLHLTLISSRKTLSQNIVKLGVRASMDEFSGDTIQSTTAQMPRILQLETKRHKTPGSNSLHIWAQVKWNFPKLASGEFEFLEAVGELTRPCSKPHPLQQAVSACATYGVFGNTNHSEPWLVYQLQPFLSFFRVYVSSSVFITSPAESFSFNVHTPQNAWRNCCLELSDLQVLYFSLTCTAAVGYRNGSRWVLSLISFLEWKGIYNTYVHTTFTQFFSFFTL